MRVAIMQPYFLPYIGYFQLIHAVDLFVVYDNIEYTKKGWINRNRILTGGGDEFITLPLQKDSDYLNVDERFIADSFDREKLKLLRKVRASYDKAPYYPETLELFESTLNTPHRNLFAFILNSIQLLTSHLDIQTPIIQSSTLDIDHSLKSEQKVLAICGLLQATTYINPIGGVKLYDKVHFSKHQVTLNFLQSNPITYPQYQNEFIPWLSILDVLMFNGKEQTKKLLTHYSLS
ncbi:MAG: WbqC family protein [Bacteroidota bacterium]